MAPLSVVPGRMRFESSSLIGDKPRCLLVEEVLAMDGVAEVSASHRTGRVLVRFDENVIARSEIERRLEAALRTSSDQTERPALPKVAPHSVKTSSPGVGHFVMEMALHAFLPGPLDLLLPVAASAFRK